MQTTDGRMPIRGHPAVVVSLFQRREPKQHLCADNAHKAQALRSTSIVPAHTKRPLRTISHMAMPAATLTLSECFVPNWRISSTTSAASTPDCATQCTSCPSNKEYSLPALFQHTDLHSALTQFGQCVGRRIEVPPVHRILRPERRFVHLGRGWNGRDAAEHHLPQTKRIGRAKHAAHVVNTPHIVEHNRERELCGRAKIGYTETTHFIYFQFFVHTAKVNFSAEIAPFTTLWKKAWKSSR